MTHLSRHDEDEAINKRKSLTMGQAGAIEEIRTINKVDRR